MLVSPGDTWFFDEFPATEQDITRKEGWRARARRIGNYAVATLAAATGLSVLAGTGVAAAASRAEVAAETYLVPASSLKPNNASTPTEVATPETAHQTASQLNNSYHQTIVNSDGVTRAGQPKFEITQCSPEHQIRGDKLIPLDVILGEIYTVAPTAHITIRLCGELPTFVPQARLLQP